MHKSSTVCCWIRQWRRRDHELGEHPPLLQGADKRQTCSMPIREPQLPFFYTKRALTSGRGVFCLDVKTWKGKVSVQEHSWHLNFTEETEHFSNTSISQVADPIQVIKTKTENLWNHLMRSGVCVRQSLFLSRVILLNPDCHVDPELQKSKEVVAHCDLDSFIRSFKVGYLAWISDAVTPYLLFVDLICSHAVPTGRSVLRL
ncbi:hypothetical protein EOD39_1841 [Acipenser ruthenus]|uniref:NERD domain-containing protein n=1 Tax=Acipenser ruthenus TaxID=7906 RepID=A0A444U755_ACIRT|nr:hypothetical protein EOD39_1841 [Acipenser ruthenus]